MSLNPESSQVAANVDDKTANRDEHNFILPDVKIIVPFLLFTVLIAKAYGIANFSLTTAAALISATPLSIVIGIVALYIYAFAALVGVFSAALFCGGFMKRYQKRCRPLMPLTCTLAVFAILLSPWQYTVDALVCTAVALLCYGVLHLLRMHVSLHATAATVVMLLLVTFIFATLRTPWLPGQVVTLNKQIAGNPTHSIRSLTRKPVGYVINDANGWTTMLIDDDRYIAQFPDSYVVSREICHMSDQFPGEEPLFGTIFGQTYQPHDLSCWRLTDQPDEIRQKTSPFVIRLLTW